MNEVNAQYQQQYGPGDYVPNVFVQYWSMRVMAYLGALVVLLGAVGRVGCCGGAGSTRSRVFLWCATWAVLLPFLMNTAGWMLTENGRQPWIVQGLMRTSTGCRRRSARPQVVDQPASCSALSTSPWASSTLILMLRYARRGLEPASRPATTRSTTRTDSLRASLTY